MIHRYLLLIALFGLTLPAQAMTFEHIVLDDNGPHDPWVKTIGDLDGDGAPDVIIGGRGGPVYWYPNAAAPAVEIATGGYNTVDGECGDIDGDGDEDVVIGGEFWYENPRPASDPKSGHWPEHRISELRTHDIELADLDGDGTLELIARDQSGFGHNTGNRIHLWKHKGDDWIHSEFEIPHGEGLLAGDLDKDGDVDIITGGYWYENDGAGSGWAAHPLAPEWHPDAAVAMGDLNGDGRNDVALTRSEGPYRLSWFEAPRGGDGAWTEHPIDPSVDFAHGVRIADMDGDGRNDVVTAEMHQSERDRVMVYLNPGAGSDWKRVILAETGSHDIRVADLNGDGRPDIMGANWSGPFQPVEIWLNHE
ncbi:MAG: hypothetical protein GC154_13540 [bacterium]|nr:hypothetical protein [bacterium]